MLHRHWHNKYSPRNKYSWFYLNFKFEPLKNSWEVYFLRHKVLGIDTNCKTKFNFAFFKDTYCVMFFGKKLCFCLLFLVAYGGGGEHFSPI
jgi:hypothetical protein